MDRHWNILLWHGNNNPYLQVVYELRHSSSPGGTEESDALSSPSFPQSNFLSSLENFGSIPQVLQTEIKTSNFLLNVVLVINLSIPPEWQEAGMSCRPFLGTYLTLRKIFRDNVLSMNKSLLDRFPKLSGLLDSYSLPNVDNSKGIHVKCIRLQFCQQYTFRLPRWSGLLCGLWGAPGTRDVAVKHSQQ